MAARLLGLRQWRRDWWSNLLIVMAGVQGNPTAPKAPKPPFDSLGVTLSIWAVDLDGATQVSALKIREPLIFLFGLGNRGKKEQPRCIARRTADLLFCVACLRFPSCFFSTVNKLIPSNRQQVNNLLRGPGLSLVKVVW